MAAQRYSAATLEGMAIEAENAAAKLKGEPPPHRVKTEDDLDDDEEEARAIRLAKKKAKTLNAARALIDSGVDPDVVARMMLQLPGENTNPQPSGERASLKDLTGALVDLDSIRQGNKGNGNEDRILELIKEMREEAKEQRRLITQMLTDGIGGKKDTVDPITAARNQARAMSEFSETMVSYAKSLGYQAPGSSTDARGASNRKTVEELKEENRHSEEMARLGADKEYKVSLANAIGELPERIGMGIANNIKAGPASKDADGMNTFKCQTCGSTIYAPPNAPKVICPKCKAEYESDDAKASRLANESKAEPEPKPVAKEIFN